MAHPKVLAFVLAGGKGERLKPLTAFRSKPSIPFGGRYRIVDFVLSNLVNSHIYSIYLLVQYKSQSLIEHVRRNWVLSSVMKDHFVAVVPPQMRMGPEWFQGTADAVFQNVNLIRTHMPKLVIVFGADHVYRIDIRQMIDFHLEKDAFVTVAARPVPLDQASSFGIIKTDSENRIIGFEEKPEHPSPMPSDPTRAYASMGNYIFNTNVLQMSLERSQERSHHDFGKHVIPAILDTNRIFAYDFGSNIVPGTREYEEQGYWRDVGAIPAYYEAHMDMLGEKPLFELDNSSWPIHPTAYEGPSTKILDAEIHNSIIADGSTIHGARLRNSVIRSGVVIQEGVTVEDCIIMDHTVIRKGCRLRKAIIDKMNIIPAGDEIGFDPDRDRSRCMIESGITVMPKQGKFGEAKKS